MRPGNNSPTRTLYGSLPAEGYRADEVRNHLHARVAFGTLTASMVVAVVWWLATPAGLVGSLAGAWILTGFLLALAGLFLASGGDRVLDNMLPGANVGRMAEQGSTGERRFLVPRPRWGGALALLGGMVYLAVGALLWRWH